MKKRFSEEQIIGFLGEAEAGLSIKKLCRRHGFSEASYYLWCSKFGGMSVPDVKRLKKTRSRKWTLEKAARRVFAGDGGHSRGAEKKGVSAPARREMVHFMVSHGLSERRALLVIRMSASALRYQSVPDRNETLRERIISLAHHPRRYGAGMIYLRLCQAGEQVNHKRVERLYATAQLQVKHRKSKKVPTSERKPLGHPCAANQAWSMDFVCDRTADG